MYEKYKLTSLKFYIIFNLKIFHLIFDDKKSLYVIMKAISIYLQFDLYVF